MDIGSHGISNVPLSLGDGQPPKLAEFQPQLTQFAWPLASKLEVENQQLKAKLAQTQANAFNPLNPLGLPSPALDPLGLFNRPIPKPISTAAPKPKQIISTV